MAEPADLTPDLSLVDATETLQRINRSTVFSATQSVEDNADDAARAQNLAQLTGDHPALIYSDLEAYERQQKVATTSAILNSNAHLRDFAASHPLAPKVANDDWAQLDTISGVLDKVRSKLDLGGTLSGQGPFWDTFRETFDVEGQRQEYERLLSAVDDPWWRSFVQHSGAGGAAVALSGAMRALSGLFTGAAVGAGEIARHLGATEDQSHAVARDALIAAQTIPMGLHAAAGGIHPKMAAEIGEAARLARAVKPFVDAGKKPIPGLHPAVDEVLKEASKHDLETLDEAVKESQKSTLRERSPELYSGFAELKLGDEQIGISAEAVSKLYGDKLPEPNDGKLGFIPNLTEQMAAAIAVNGDIYVPYKDYLAHVDAEVHREIKDFVKVRPDGLSRTEAKELKVEAREEPKEGEVQAIEPPTEPIREAAGLRPLVSGYPKISLARETSRIVNYGKALGEANVHEFSLRDEAGTEVGMLQLTEERDGKRLYVDNIEVEPPGGGVSDKDAYNTIGTKNVRDLLAKLAQEFPNAEEVGGLRTGGARLEAKGEEGIAEAWVKLPKVKEPPKEAEPTTPMSDRPAFETSPPGMSKENYRLWRKAMDKQREADIDAEFKRTERATRKRLSQDWNDKREALRPEAIQTVRARGDVRADDFFRAGNKIKASLLTEEQKAGLPRAYYAKDGIDPDQIASQFDFETGDRLVDALAQYDAARKASGNNPIKFTRDLIDAELEAQMERRYGSFDENLLTEIKDQILSAIELDRLHEETVYFAELAGAELPLPKADLHAAMEESFKGQPIGAVASEIQMAHAGKAARAAEAAMLKGDFQEAFKQAQFRENAIIQARLAKDVEANVAKFNKTAERLRERGPLKNMDQEYLNFVHVVLSKIGKPINRTPTDLAREIEAAQGGYKNLADFVKGKENEVFGMTQLDVADFLLDDNFKKEFDSLTVDEFNAVKASVDLLAHHGREVKKVEVAGEKIDLDNLREQAAAQVQTFPKKPHPESPSRLQKAMRLPRSFVAKSTSMETLLNRWDRGDPRGLLKKWILYPLADGANFKARMEREIAPRYRALGKIENQGKLLESPLMQPGTQEPLHQFTKENAMVILQNYGNASNWKKFTDGWRVDPQALKQWLFDKTADGTFTEADWKRSKGLGDIFGEVWEQEKEAYRKRNGIAPESVELGQVETPFGPSDGWYHPVIKHPYYEEGTSKKQRGGDVYSDADYGHANTSNGFTKRRTGAAYPVSLTYDTIPTRLSQMIHDLWLRDPVINAEKLFSDTRFRRAVADHYGPEYREGLMEYLRGVAGSASVNMGGLTDGAKVMEYLRQNTIATYIGFNPYTALKHGPTALALSMKEVGAENFIRAFSSLYSKSEDLTKLNRDWVDETFEDVARRKRHWDETFVGVHKEIYGQPTVREKFMQAGSWLVAQSDMISTRATALAAYWKAVEEGSDPGEAVTIANAAVRRAHGSTAVTNLPTLVSQSGVMGSWMTTLYGFFGTMFQRRLEIVHALNDGWRLGQAKEIDKATGRFGDALMGAFVYYVIPTTIEEWVTGLTTEDHKGWGHHILFGALGGLGSSVLFVRDMISGLLHDRDPQVGLISSPLHDFRNLKNDLAKGKKMFSKEQAGRTVKDFLTVLGETRGIGGKIPGSAAGGMIDVSTGKAKPKTFTDWRMLMTRGQMKPRIER